MAKQLRELLQEKQEPFMLDLYLLEKGYPRKRFISKNVVQSCDLQRTQKGILPCSQVLKDVCNLAIIKNSNPRELRNYEETSTSQHTTIRVAEDVTDRKLYIEESRQLSPVSVLEEVPSNRDRTKKLSSMKQKKVTEDSILSASLWKILFQSAREKPAIPEIQELVHSNISGSNLKSKKVLQQTRQLLFDCVREIVETQQRKKRQQQQKREYLAREDFGKLIEEKIGCWGKKYGEELNLAVLLELDFRNSAEAWISYKPYRRRIGCEIGDAILEELMNQIVIDMV